TAVVAPIETVCREVDPRMRVRADEEWRIPIPSQRLTRRLIERLNANVLASLQIEARQNPELRLGVYGARVGRIDDTAKPIAAGGDKPVRVANTVVGTRSARTANREVVLSSAIHIVERFGLIGHHAVVLCDRQVGHEAPCAAAVERFVDAAVTSDDEVVGRI